MDAIASSDFLRPMDIMSEESRTLQDKFMLRLPDGMRERIAVEARRHGRSMNAEIVRTLEKAYPIPPSAEDIAGSLQRTIGVLATRRSESLWRILQDELKDLLDKIEGEPNIVYDETHPRKNTKIRAAELSAKLDPPKD